MSHASSEFIPAHIAILTVSDSRGAAEDTSGQYLREAVQEAGHQVVDRAIVKDDIYQIRARVSAWIADDNVQAVLITGGTGLPPATTRRKRCCRCSTERWKGSANCSAWCRTKIGTATIQSRALAGLANRTVIFAMPGSTRACRTAWERIIEEQLDARHRPCNFQPHLKKP